MLNLKRRYNDYVPGFRVDAEIKKQLQNLADQERVSISEIIRASVTFFLAENATKSINKAGNSINKGEQQ